MLEHSNPPNPDATAARDSTPTIYYKSTVAWNGNGWDVRLRDGTTYVFRDNAGLASIRDRNGNTITIKRQSDNPNGNIIQVTSPNGRWVTFTYDTTNRITQAKDNAGRIVTYEYNAAGYLWKVTDPGNGVTEYGYDANNRMRTLKDARNITFLTNDYDANGRVQKQTQADTSFFQYGYTVVGGKVTQTDVTDPRGHVRRVTFNGDGYPLTDTGALGTPEQQTVTYERQPEGNLPTAVTDELGRRTEFTYNDVGDVTSVTTLAGTSGRGHHDHDVRAHLRPDRVNHGSARQHDHLRPRRPRQRQEDHGRARQRDHVYAQCQWPGPDDDRRH